MLKTAFKWLMAHWGWGHWGYHESRFRAQLSNPQRQAIKAYCEEFKVTRKQAKRQTKVANATKANWKKDRLRRLK